jgi:hypothetical protein
VSLILYYTTLLPAFLTNHWAKKQHLSVRWLSFNRMALHSLFQEQLYFFFFTATTNKTEPYRHFITKLPNHEIIWSNTAKLTIITVLLHTNVNLGICQILLLRLYLCNMYADFMYLIKIIMDITIIMDYDTSIAISTNNTHTPHTRY